MSHELICTWLGLNPGDWPPDHYRLLGLNPGESNPELIEQHVHQRLDRVRCYQVCHPEQATEVLNRIAQAFDCLTEPAAKQRYDATLGLPEATKTEDSPASLPEAIPIATAVAEPPPLPTMHNPPVTVADPTPMPDELVLPRPVPPPPPPPTEKICPLLELARSVVAARGVGTRRALARRIRRTRELYETWIRAGKYLGTVKRRTTLKGPDAEELAELFERIARQCRRFPRILGEAGQPGYLVLSLVRHDPVKTFRTLEFSQREAMRGDWQAGRDLLLAYRDFLREQATELRLMTPGQRFRRAVAAFFTDDPKSTVLLFVLAAINGLLAWLGWFEIHH